MKTSKVVRLARIKNKHKWQEWLDGGSKNPPSIEIIRKITKKIPYSMADDSISG